MSTRWKYMVVGPPGTKTTEEFVDYLNNTGDGGWELVQGPAQQVQLPPVTFFLIFKRPVAD